LSQALAALGVRLGADDLAQIAATVPTDAVAGTRYAAAGMAMVNR
jgi:hypothetical protein